RRGRPFVSAATSCSRPGIARDGQRVLVDALVDDDAHELPPFALAQPYHERHGDDGEPDHEPPPETDRPEIETEREQEADRDTEAPERGDIDQHRHARVAEPSEKPQGDDLQAV